MLQNIPKQRAKSNCKSQIHVTATSGLPIAKTYMKKHAIG